MMYLSRLTLNPLNAQVRAELARPYEMHRTLLRGFPHGSVGISRADIEAAGVLFRVDEKPRENLFVVLVQSRTAPRWSFLNEHRDARGYSYLLPASMLGDGKPNPVTKEFDLSKKLAVGQTLAFRLRANPTKRLGNGAAHDTGKRVGIYDEALQLEWLQRKAEAGGFHIVRAMVSRDERIRDEIHRDDQTHDLELLSVQFDGLLRVLDQDMTRKTIENGIGSAKGFGFGLLSLARIKE
jgi:CRISPR system Cascade subunit CasE